MAGLQTVTTPVTGTSISSTAFGIPVANNVTVLANPPLAKMRNSVGLSIVTVTDTALTWDTEDYDTANGHSTVTTTSRYTCQAGYPGKYLVGATAVFAASAAGTFRDIWLAVNAVNVSGSTGRALPAAATILSVSAETVVTLAVGDFVEAFVRQDSGGALLTAIPFARMQSWFEVQWVSQ